MLVGGACKGGGLLLSAGGCLPAAMGGGACLPKAKGSVIGWAAGEGPIMAVAAAAVCLWGLVLRKALGPPPEGGGPEAPGGPVRGGGCMAAGLTGPSHSGDVTEEVELRCS